MVPTTRSSVWRKESRLSTWRLRDRFLRRLSMLAKVSLPKIWLLFAMLLAGAMASAQNGATEWSFKLDPPDVRQGESARLLITSKVPDGWWIYGLTETAGPQPLKIALSGSGLEAQGGPIEPQPEVKFDKNFKKEVKHHSATTVFALPVKVTGAAGEIAPKLVLSWQACNDESCEIPFLD